MSYPIKIFRKTVVERRRLFLDYSCWLKEETLTDFQVTVLPYTTDAPLLVTIGYTDVTNTKLVCFVSGGAKNTDYTIQMVVRTSSGQIKRDDIGMKVAP